MGADVADGEGGVWGDLLFDLEVPGEDGGGVDVRLDVGGGDEASCGRRAGGSEVEGNTKVSSLSHDMQGDMMRKHKLRSDRVSP